MSGDSPGGVPAGSDWPGEDPELKITIFPSEVVAVWEGLVRLKGWWTRLTRPGTVSGGLDNYPRCGVWPETSLGLMTAPHVWYRVGESADGFVEWKCRRCRAVAVGGPTKPTDPGRSQ